MALPVISTSSFPFLPPCRYDKLVGMFSGKDVPAVGVSIGIERVFAIMEAQLRLQAEQVRGWLPMGTICTHASVPPQAPRSSFPASHTALTSETARCPPEQAGGTIRETETEALVASIGGGMQPRRMRICSELWASGIKAEFGYKANPKMPDQVRVPGMLGAFFSRTKLVGGVGTAWPMFGLPSVLVSQAACWTSACLTKRSAASLSSLLLQLGYALKQGIPYMVLFGESEVEAGVVKIKDLDAGTEEVVAEVGRGLDGSPSDAARASMAVFDLLGGTAGNCWTASWLLHSHYHHHCCPLCLQGQLVARMQELVKTKAGRRVVYQQKEEAASS